MNLNNSSQVAPVKVYFSILNQIELILMDNLSENIEDAISEKTHLSLDVTIQVKVQTSFRNTIISLKEELYERSSS